MAKKCTLLTFLVLLAAVAVSAVLYYRSLESPGIEHLAAKTAAAAAQEANTAVQTGRANPTIQNGQENPAILIGQEKQEDTAESKEPVKTERQLLTEQAEVIYEGMTQEERVAQLFLITPEALTGYERVVRAGEATKEALKQYPVGGLIYFKQNLESPDQLKAMTSAVQTYAMEQQGIPLFLSIDEEGGAIARIGNHPAFPVQKVSSMSSLGATGNPEKAREAGSIIGAYLSEYGFNVDFAPDADVLTNPANTVVKNRSFGSDPQMVTDMVKAYLDGLESHLVYGVPKHFPGHGATAEDSHQGFAYIQKSWEELEQAELVPFRAMAPDQVDFLMVGHISIPKILGDDTPASLSYEAITGYLRGEIGYQGIVITDALNMGAIQNHYSSSEACIRSFLAGTDMLLMPADFKSAYQGVLGAVREGRISEERLKESVIRILMVKRKLMGQG